MKWEKGERIRIVEIARTLPLLPIPLLPLVFSSFAHRAGLGESHDGRHGDRADPADTRARQTLFRAGLV